MAILNAQHDDKPVDISIPIFLTDPYIFIYIYIIYCVHVQLDFWDEQSSKKLYLPLITMSMKPCCIEPVDFARHLGT